MSTDISCPKCGSNHIVAARKPSPAGAMSQQTFLTCGTGLPANLDTSSDIDVSCLQCGYDWNPKKLLEKPVAKSKVQKSRAVQWIILAIVLLALVYWFAR